MGKRPREDDEAFASSGETQSLAVPSPAKFIELDQDSTSTLAPSHTMQCSLPPHQLLSFASADQFDVHYAKEHTNRCVSCGCNLPSAHYLVLHIDENHNPVREELAAKGEKTYACFIEGCEKKSSTSQKRRLHLIDKHMFPKAYNFKIIDHGIDRTNSLLQGGQRSRVATKHSPGHRRRSSVLSVDIAARMIHAETILISPNQVQGSAEKPKSSGEQGQVGEESDQTVTGLEKPFAALKFVPPSVQARQRQLKRAT